MKFSSKGKYLLLSKILFLLFILTSSNFIYAQDSTDLADRTVWAWDEINKSSQATFKVSNRDERIVKNSIFLSTLTREASKVYKLSDGNSTLFVAIPRVFDTKEDKYISSIISVKVEVKEPGSTIILLEDFSASYNIFRESFSRLLLQQEIPKKYVTKIDVELLSVNPDELKLTLSGGDYGDATLIFTTASATPEIVIHN